MAQLRHDEPEEMPLHLLRPEEELHRTARATDVLLSVTDQRIIISDDGRISLDVPFNELRRIQFDIERTRPATLVIVPESAANPPQVLAVAPAEYDRTASALALIGRKLAGHD